MLRDRTNLRQKMAATTVEALSYRRHTNPVVRHFAIIPHVGRQGSRSKRHDAAQHAPKLVLHTNLMREPLYVLHALVTGLSAAQKCLHFFQESVVILEDAAMPGVGVQDEFGAGDATCEIA